MNGELRLPLTLEFRKMKKTMEIGDRTQIPSNTNRVIIATAQTHSAFGNASI